MQALEALPRKLQLKIRLLQDAENFNSWSSAVFGYSALGCVLLAIIYNQLISIPALLLGALSGVHLLLARRQRRKIDDLTDLLEDARRQIEEGPFTNQKPCA